MSKITRREALGLTAAMLGATALASCDDDETSQPEQSVPEGHVVEVSRTIPVLVETDVLVLGSGPAGLSAALAAAREGVNTVLVERYGAFGGVITQQTMGSIAWYRFVDTIDAGGIRGEFEERAKEMGATIDVFGEEGRGLVSDTMLDQFHEYLEETGLRKDGVPTYEILETELFKWVADQMLLEAGVVPLLHCWAVDVIMEGDTIKGVVTESKSGRQAILAKRVIDCTGDADVAKFAGAPFTQGPNSELMESTVQFGLAGVDLEEVLMYLYLNSGGLGDWSDTGGETSNMMTPRIVEPYVRAKAMGTIPEEDDIEYTTYMGCFTDANELPDMNTIHIHGIDPTNVWDLTGAEIKGRERAIWAIEALKTYTPGFRNARIRTFAPALGVRESRKIVGGYKITEDDVRSEARFDDSIGICPEFLDGFGLILLPTTGRYFQIPYGAILPEKIENLLVAGRSVDSDRMAFTATRQMACCCVTGQGAGVAAAVSIKDEVTCRDVDIAEVQRRLEAQGVRIS